jgi:hypothetical protein
MIKNRSFMFGLGTGLISGALLLQLMISGGAAPLTKEELITEAAKLNLNVTDPAAVPQGSSEPADQEAGGNTQKGQTAGTPASSPTSGSPTPSPSPAASPQEAVKPSPAAVPTKPATPSQPVQSAGSVPVAPATPEAAVSGTVSLSIPAGSTLTETARQLAQAGIITDQTKFLQTAMDRKINTRIQYGDYSFTKGESINSIIDKLITVK